MICPACGSNETDVIRTSSLRTVSRERQCKCGARWDTKELFVKGSLRTAPGIENLATGSNKNTLPVASKSATGSTPRGGRGGSVLDLFPESGSSPISASSPSRSLEADQQRSLEQTRARSKGAANYSSAFLMFWREYPRKTGKGAAWDAWRKLQPPIADALAALAWQRQSADWRKDNGAFIPHPATYLNQRRWEDEPSTPVAQPRRPYA